LSLEDNIRFLARTPLLAVAGKEALRLLAFSAERVELDAGDILFGRGEEATGGYAVIRGRIRLVPAGGPERVVGPGALIGEMALLVETRRPCDAYALEPAVLLAIPRQLFMRMLEEFPTIAAAMRTKLISRMKAQTAELQRIDARLDLPGPGPKTERL